MLSSDRTGSLILVSVTGADIAGTLKYLIDRNLMLYDITYKEELTVEFYMNSKNMDVLKSIVAFRGDSMEVRSENMMHSLLKRSKRRLVFLFGCVMICIFSIWIPSRVFFVEVIGNQSLEERYIQETVNRYGIYFGVRRADIRSETLKNTLLSEIPELDWVGVTTAGCVATVEVREKPDPVKESENRYPVSSIVASTDGVIEQITVTKGMALCKKGQAVRQGQVLISAYEDCGFKIKATNAEGEVIAQTMRRNYAISPTTWTQRMHKTQSETNYSIILGKNMIKLNNNSGISPACCVKISEEKPLVLPGGFQLPLSILSETYETYSTEEVVLNEVDFSWVDPLVESYIFDRMTAGQILRKKSEFRLTDDFYHYQTVYICREHIGKYRIEETLNEHGKYS